MAISKVEICYHVVRFTSTGNQSPLFLVLVTRLVPCKYTILVASLSLLYDFQKTVFIYKRFTQFLPSYILINSGVKLALNIFEQLPVNLLESNFNAFIYWKCLILFDVMTNVLRARIWMVNSIWSFLECDEYSELHAICAFVYIFIKIVKVMSTLFWRTYYLYDNYYRSFTRSPLVGRSLTVA